MGNGLPILGNIFHDLLAEYRSSRKIRPSSISSGFQESISVSRNQKCINFRKRRPGH